MNRFVADPGWHDLIVWYFFLGGIAAGAYVMAALVDLVGTAEDRRGVRWAYYLAFPLVNICGVLLILDLGRPERFWHMMIQNNTLRPMLKWWSPMSAGSWALAAFGFFSFASFLGVLAEDRRFGLARFSTLAARLRTGWTGRIFAFLGAIAAFFLGSYTGVLLHATNQPLWAQTTWLGAVFLASAASTGVATLILCNRLLEPHHTSHRLIERLERLDAWAMVLELGLLATLAWSLKPYAKEAFTAWPGLLIPAFVIPFGLILPMILQPRLGTRLAVPLAVLVLTGGFALRMAVVGWPIPFLSLAQSH